MSDDVGRVADALEDAYEAATGHLAGLPTLEILDAMAPRVLSAIRAAAYAGRFSRCAPDIGEDEAINAALAALTETKP